MSNGNRGTDTLTVVNVFIGIALVAYLFWLAYHFGYSHAERGFQASANSQKYADSASDDIKNSCPFTDPATLAECAYKIVESTHEEQRAERDLVAQIDVAQWTFWLIPLTILGLAATVVGIWFVRENLREIRITNELSRDMGKAQTRAYVHVSSFKPYARQERGRLQAKIEIEFSNTGQSPATLNGYSTDWRCPTANPSGFTTSTIELTREIGPQSSFTVDLDIDAAVEAPLKPNKMEVTIRYAYSDIFGKQEHKSVRFVNYFTMVELTDTGRILAGNCLGTVPLDDSWLDSKRSTPPYGDET